PRSGRSQRRAGVVSRLRRLAGRQALGAPPADLLVHLHAAADAAAPWPLGGRREGRGNYPSPDELSAPCRRDPLAVTSPPQENGETGETPGERASAICTWCW